MIFPTLAGKRVGYVNLNTYADRWLKEWHYSSPLVSQLLEPRVCDQMVAECHRELGLDWSYGGWLEDRSILWSGSYLEKDKKFIHLGVDFNAPAGTPVSSDDVLRVLEVDDDTPLEGGWGSRVIAQIKGIGSGSNMVLLYAHLDPHVNCKVGDLIHPNAPFAKVGSPEHNGGWYPHVHVQAMTYDTYYSYKSHPDDLDGYGPTGDIEVSALARQFPDPLRYVRIS